MGPDPETWSTSAPLPWPSVEYAAREGEGCARRCAGGSGRGREEAGDHPALGPHDYPAMENRGYR